MRRAAVVLAAVALLAGGCEADAPPPAPEPPVAVAWQPVALPMPAGAGGRLVVRDVVACPGVWFVVGAVRDPRGGTRPAAWTSPDARTWTALTLDAKTYYGRQNVLSTVACRDGRMAAVGAKSGGAHGNPRTSSWHQTADGVLHEVRAPFELFGGPRAVNVARMDGGPAGFLIVGNRMSGAAIWRSPDAAEFEIREGAPALASDASGVTWAFDATATPDGWLVAGGFLPKGRIDRDVMGWRSADGSVWERVPAAGASDAYEELQRVVMHDAVPVGAGLRGSAFGVWRLAAGEWRPVGSFGSVPPGGLSSVRALSVAGDRLFCVTTDGASYFLWVSDDGGAGWRAAALPVAVPARAESAVVVAGDGQGRAVLLSDDGADGRIYVAASGT
ncbi:MAG TPA: hypothetical protein VFR35_15350 [Actinoplanes sp.]|nr:hypothetical protein [Actinoplanes sp.]